MEPKLLLLDEITSALDPELVGEVLSVVRELARDGHDHDPGHPRDGFARDVGSRVVFMDAGRVAVEGTPEEVFGIPERTAAGLPGPGRLTSAEGD